MTRHSYQQGYVSEPIRTRRGTAFVIRYRVRSADGTWTHKQETLHDVSGRKAARSILDDRIREATNHKPEVQDLTVNSFVADFWRPYLERKNVKPSTKLSYESGLKHLLPLLGDLRLVDVAPLHIEEVLQKKLQAGLSAKTVRNLLAILQSVFSLAVDNDLIPRTPIRKKHKPTVRRIEKLIWTPEQMRKIIDSAPTGHHALFACAALTGARLGELLALQWKHVDLGNRMLRIEQSLWSGQILPPKTEGSVRTIAFGEALATALTDHKGKTLHNPESFVFCKRDGSPLQPDVLRRDVLYPMLDRLQIPRPPRSAGFHAFRHSAGSYINSETGNLKLAQRLLGHSTLSTTADIYTHTSAEAEKDAALAVERAIYGNLFANVREIANTNSSGAPN